MLWGSLDGRGVGEEWMPADVWLSPFAIHLKLSQLLFVNWLIVVVVQSLSHA